MSLSFLLVTGYEQNRESDEDKPIKRRATERRARATRGREGGCTPPATASDEQHKHCNRSTELFHRVLNFYFPHKRRNTASGLQTNKELIHCTRNARNKPIRPGCMYSKREGTDEKRKRHEIHPVQPSIARILTQMMLWFSWICCFRDRFLLLLWAHDSHGRSQRCVNMARSLVKEASVCPSLA